MQRELGIHLEQLVKQHMASGMSESEARMLARREFGSLEATKENCRDTRRMNWIEDLRRDLGYALRSMGRAPQYTVVAILSLALAIGANTAIFSLVNTLMLRDLRVANRHELFEIGRAPNSQGNFSYPLYERLRDQSMVFSGVLTMSSGTLQATVEHAARQPAGRYVSWNFFEVLGVSPVIGRLLSSADDRLDPAEESTLTVIGHGLWQRDFGGEPDVIGKTLRIDGVPFTIVGVLSPKFDGLVAGRADDFYIPMASEPRLRRQSWLDNHHFNWLKVVGRLKPHASQEAAKAELDVIFGRFIEDFDFRITEAGAGRLTIEPAHAGLSELRREYARPVLLLMGAVGFVLLIACGNVVNLLLARGMARRREISLRLAMGASRGRLIRQLLTESAMLGLIGGALGLVFAAWCVRVPAAFVADGDPTISLGIVPDSAVLLFTASISLGSALLAGLAPAVRLSRANLGEAMHGARTANLTRAVALWSRASIAIQVAFSLLLLTGASLLVTSLRNLRTFDAGFDREQVLMIGLNPAKGGYTPGDRLLAYYRQVLETARNIPGVRAAGLSFITPISGSGVDLSFGLEGKPRDPDGTVYVNDVSGGYFTAMGITLLLGRDFSAQDGPDSSRVAIINDALARRYFQGQNPIGQRVRLGAQSGLEIIGVVENAKYVSLREEDHPTAYVHALQKRDRGALTLSVKMAGDPLSLAPAIQREVQAVAAAAPVAQAKTLSAQIDRSLVKERLMTRLLGLFAGLALLLALVGLYGVLGYTVTRRTNEIGVRFALGATRGAVMWSVLSDSSKLVAMGVAIGVPAALALTRLLSSLLYGVAPTDPWALSGVVLCLFFVALAAASLPAWRASRVDPLVALRCE
jgi:predicted permease